MAPELNRIERPPVDRFLGKRKLFLVPLVYEPPTDVEEGQEILARYWDQAQQQVTYLESRLGASQLIFHEGLTSGGSAGLQSLEPMGQQSYALVEAKCKKGAILEATEDSELLNEMIDLQRCLMLPFQSNKIAHQLQVWLDESIRTRYDHIASRIDSSIRDGQVGLLLINERHQVQFPSDLEVIFVSPPALDEYQRWLTNWIRNQNAMENTDSQSEPTDSE